VTERLLTASEVAEMLNVPVGWVREHTRSGGDPARPARASSKPNGVTRSAKTARGFVSATG
jgi:hypothetical protein